MKKIFLLFLISITVGLSAQVPRMILVEEFSGENCGPCAATWPHIKSLVDPNTSKLNFVKYQCNIPSGTTVLYSEYKAVDTRLSFYGVNSAPWGQQDGSPIAPGASSPTHPGNWTQALIDSRSTVMSPISINVSHTFSSDNSQLSYTYNVTNETGSAISGSYTVYVNLIESLIKFAKAPGSNGETEFTNVTRYMDPSPSGTAITLPAAGASTPGMGNITLPSYIRSKNQLRLVVWVQNNATKEVIQSAMSTLVIPNNFTDGALGVQIPTSSDFCKTSDKPNIRIYNKGVTPITSAVVSYGLSGGTSQTYTFSGNIAAGDSSALISLNSITLTGTKYNVINLSLTAVNGKTDDDGTNNSTSYSYFVTKPTAVALPLKVDFETSTTIGGQTFTNGGILSNASAGYIVDKSVSSAATSLLGGFGLSAKSFRVRPFYANYLGENMSAYMDKVNLSTLSATEAGQINYSFAFAKANATTADSFYVEASGDCGLTWTQLQAKSSDDISTHSDLDPQSSFFYPTATDWKKDSVQISGVSSLSAVMVRIRYQISSDAASTPGNCFYIDDINITKATKSSSGNTGNTMDSVRVNLALATSPTGTEQEVIKGYKDTKGKQYTWRYVSEKLPSNWSLVSICDNFQCYSVISSVYKYTAQGNPDLDFLKVDIKHNRNVGYGYVICNHYDATDSAKTSLLTRFALFVSQNGAVSQIVNNNDKVLHYFDKTLFVDRDFKNSDLKVSDINGRSVHSTKIESDNISLDKLNKGVYIATVFTEGSVAKSIKFVVE